MVKKAETVAFKEVKARLGLLTERQLLAVIDEAQDLVAEERYDRKLKSIEIRLLKTSIKDLEGARSNAAYYISPTLKKKFAGGFFVLNGGQSTVFAKTKTGVLYKFDERDRRWHAA